MANSPWKPISGTEVEQWRKRLPKGAIREFNTAQTQGLDQLDSDDDVSVTKTPPVTTIAQAAPPREVAEDIYGMVWRWAQGSREAFQMFAQIVRTSNPTAFGHLSDDELATKIEQHARDAARSATEEVYEKWDKGNNLDLWSGKPVKKV